MKYLKVEPNQTDWDNFVLSHSEANFLSSWAMAEATNKAGKKSLRLMISDGQAVVAVVRASLISARRGTYIEVGGGPILDWSNRPLVDFVFDQIKQQAKQCGAGHVRIRTQLVKSADSLALLKSVGLKPAPMHLYAEHTTILDLTKPREQILLEMRKKTRYQIKQSAKQGITVKNTTDRATFDGFLKLQVDTAARQGFGLPKLTELEAEFDVLNAAGLVTLYSAYKDSQLLAQAMMVTFNGEMDYLYGASTLDGRNSPGSYAIQMQAIDDGQAAALSRYNLWGTSPSDKPDHRFAQITTFKNGFGGGDYLYTPAHDLVVSRFAYLKTFLIETVRRKKRKL